MRTGLLSIRAQYAEAIFAGTKRFEFRTKAPCIDGPTRFLIYVPSPRGELAGEMLVSEVLALPPRELWAHTRHAAGIPGDDFQAYFRGRSVGHALVILKAHRYDRPRGLAELRRVAPGGFSPPQFLRWLSPAALAAVLG